MTSTSRKNQLREELSEMSFEEIQELREKLGTKLFNKALSEVQTSEKSQGFQRENKNRPREESSKKPVSRFREIIPVKKQTLRDPRFDEISGTYKEHLFKTNYKFLSKMRAKEKKELKLTLKKEQDAEKRKEIRDLLNKFENQERADKMKAEKKAVKAQLKKEEIEQLNQGQKPFYQKKSSIRKRELVEKFNDLKTKNKLDKYIIRKRKKELQKERKHSKL